MLTKCIPWNQRLMFCAVEQRYITPVIERFVNERKIGHYEIWRSIQFELDQNVFLEKSKILPITVPEAVEIQPLNPEDAFFVIESWGYKSDDLYSVAQVQFCIKKLYSM
ncbi:unnamed protein product, partial [Rotaria sordida]